MQLNIIEETQAAIGSSKHDAAAEWTGQGGG